MRTIPTNVITTAKFVGDDALTVVAVTRDDIGLGVIERNDDRKWQFIAVGDIGINQDELCAIWSVVSMLAVRDELL